MSLPVSIDNVFCFDLRYLPVNNQCLFSEICLNIKNQINVTKTTLRNLSNVHINNIVVGVLKHSW